MCCNNAGDGGVDVDGKYDVNIWELLLWHVACQRGRTELMWGLAQLMVLRVVVVLVSAPSVIVREEVLDLMFLALGQGMVMGQDVLSILAQRELVSISTLFLVQYDEMLLAPMSDR